MLNSRGPSIDPCRISSFYVSGGTVKIKISENSLPLPITHVSDFKEHFPAVNLAPPSESL